MPVQADLVRQQHLEHRKVEAACKALGRHPSRQKLNALQDLVSNLGRIIATVGVLGVRLAIEANEAIEQPDKDRLGKSTRPPSVPPHTPVSPAGLADLWLTKA